MSRRDRKRIIKQLLEIRYVEYVEAESKQQNHRFRIL